LDFGLVEVGGLIDKFQAAVMVKWGGRRYAAWEVLNDIFAELYKKGREVKQNLKPEKLMALA